MARWQKYPSNYSLKTFSLFVHDSSTRNIIKIIFCHTFKRFLLNAQHVFSSIFKFQKKVLLYIFKNIQEIVSKWLIIIKLSAILTNARGYLMQNTTQLFWSSQLTHFLLDELNNQSNTQINKDNLSLWLTNGIFYKTFFFFMFPATKS